MARNKSVYGPRQRMINLMYVVLMAMLAMKTPASSDSVEVGDMTATDSLEHKDLTMIEPDTTGTMKTDSMPPTHIDIERTPEQPVAVAEPSATIAADMMNFLYAGIDNPLSVTVAGVPQANVQIAMTGATLTKLREGHYIAKPLAEERRATMTVFNVGNGTRKQIATQTFQVRRLTEPSPYILVDDGSRFKGGTMTKKSILKAKELQAAIDDGVLDIGFKVLSFDIVVFDSMGNTMSMPSDGAAFSERQKEAIARLNKVRRFYISRIRVVGPDNTERTLKSSMEVVIR